MCARLRSGLLAAIAVPVLSACQGIDTDKLFASERSKQAQGIEIIPIASELALRRESELSKLAAQLDQELLVRSGAVQELRAAKARRKAAKLARFPKILLTAGHSINGGGYSVGIEVERNLLDFGATRAAIDVAELDIQEKRMNLWRDRNQTVYYVLFAPVLCGNLGSFRSTEL